MNLKLFFAVCVAVFSNVALARTECPTAKIVHIQIEAHYIIYLQEGGAWRLLGMLADAGVKERYSALLSAQAAGRRIMVAYASNSFNCYADNYTESALLVRTFND